MYDVTIANCDDHFEQKRKKIFLFSLFPDLQTILFIYPERELPNEIGTKKEIIFRYHQNDLQYRKQCLVDKQKYKVEVVFISLIQLEKLCSYAHTLQL